MRGNDRLPIGPFCLATLILPALLASANRATAAEDNSPTVTPLLSTGTTVAGETLHYPASGAAHVTAEIVTLPPGGRTALHKHGVPMFAYILDGEITVDYGGHGKRTYRKADSIMEAMDVAHFGADTGAQPVRILVVFMGAEGVADTIPMK
ncbi:MAG: cupin domain-containing protein [Xanthobacteraceae bacterium]